MTYRFSRVLAALAVAFVFTGLCVAQSGRRITGGDDQQTTGEQQSKDQTIKLRTDEVLLNVTVKDP
ncbi:MAG TPA: hypothetical protein VI756_19040, partial [Blastocatellia bacterium]